MPGSNSCGEPLGFDGTATDAMQQVNREKQRIEQLEHEVMRYRVDAQQKQLDDMGEEFFRRDHPAVQDAWDQYQTVLRLAKGK